jgi:hypothetical protein
MVESICFEQANHNKRECVFCSSALIACVVLFLVAAPCFIGSADDAVPYVSTSFQYCTKGIRTDNIVSCARMRHFVSQFPQASGEGRKGLFMLPVLFLSVRQSKRRLARSDRSAK